MSSLLQVLVCLLFIGFLGWVIGILKFIQPTIKQLLQGLLLFVSIVWVLYIIFAVATGKPIPVLFR